MILHYVEDNHLEEELLMSLPFFNSNDKLKGKKIKNSDMRIFE
jgi:hypothetical protein